MQPLEEIIRYLVNSFNMMTDQLYSVSPFQVYQILNSCLHVPRLSIFYIHVTMFIYNCLVTLFSWGSNLNLVNGIDMLHSTINVHCLPFSGLSDINFLFAETFNFSQYSVHVQFFVIFFSATTWGNNLKFLLNKYFTTTASLNILQVFLKL